MIGAHPPIKSLNFDEKEYSKHFLFFFSRGEETQRAFRELVF
jgi:hypothetical protein